MTDQPAPKPKKLEPLLRELIARAYNTTSRVSLTLQNGLTVYMRIIDDIFYIGIAREHPGPSLIEWNTVCKAAKFPIVEPNKGNNTLWCGFRLTSKLLEW